MFTRNRENTEIVKKSESSSELAERPRSRRTFLPDVDIVETDSALLVYADVPGADEKSVDITLEDRSLVLHARVDEAVEKGNVRYLHREYETGDFRRSFALSDEIDTTKIEARVRNGVLTLTLPKSERASVRKVLVKAG